MDVKVGDQLPPFVREGTVAHWNRFAAVNYEFAAHHWDHEVAKSEGFDAPFAMAPLQLAFFHAMLRDWMGEGGRIVSIAAKLRAPFFKDQTVTATATVVALQSRDGETYVDLELAQVDAAERSIVIGTAQVVLPA